MVALFAFVACVLLGAPWWAFVIGYLCILIED